MAGRPAYYESPESLQQGVDAYFEHIKGEWGITQEAKDGTDAIYGWVRFPESATITGLALYLGFNDRQSLYDYQNKDEFSCIIKKARTLVECEYEKKLAGSSPTGAIFALKNMGWKDKTELQHSGDQESPIIFKKADGRSVKP